MTDDRRPSSGSLWLDGAPTLPDDPVPERADIVVVGAGITGLTTALLLARGGRSVAVVEARHVGAVTTGRTTAKVSLLQGTKLSTMRQYQSAHVVRAYVEANREGQGWLLRFCDDHGVAVQRPDAITFAEGPDQVVTVRREHDAAREAGVDVQWRESFDVPFRTLGGAVLPEQAQLDPMELLHALVEQARAHGATLHQGRRVRTVDGRTSPTVVLDDGGRIDAEHVVLATGTPILDRGLYFAKLEPERSYLTAFALPGVPRDMYLSGGSPSRSVRWAPAHDGTDLLLVGGEGHVVGRSGSRSEAARLDALRTWTARHFPGARETHAWSAQDYRTHDTVPYVGPLPRGGGHVHVATGFDKWGMTNGVAAARAISGEILGSLPSWQKPMRHRITRPRGAAHVATTNLKVGVAQVGAGLDAATTSAADVPSEGAGWVGRRGLVPTGVATVDGRTCSVAAVCTHLGGTLRWNDAERSWDCPLHGSRFAPDGEVLEGPATRPLRRRD